MCKPVFELGVLAFEVCAGRHPVAAYPRPYVPGDVEGKHVVVCSQPDFDVGFWPMLLVVRACASDCSFP